MGAAITLLVILTSSVLVVLTAAVALRLTGMLEDVACFQARSAFTGACFTTSGRGRRQPSKPVAGRR